MTTISIIVSLVFWSSMWGIIGAVLSVPLLSLMAILLQEADHPLAARLLHGIREDSKVDELREALKMKPRYGKAQRKARAAEEAVAALPPPPEPAPAPAPDAAARVDAAAAAARLRAEGNAMFNNGAYAEAWEKRGAAREACYSRPPRSGAR